MGHLDPFFQELNGIGILALIVTVIAVIVRVMFCKTMKERVLTAVAGLVFAVIASLGADMRCGLLPESDLPRQEAPPSWNSS